jgi:hypothetical protein
MLTKLKIDNLKPQTKARKYADSEGLYLQVTPLENFGVGVGSDK